MSCPIASLHISQPAVSRQIKELGCVLFKRKSHGVELSENGIYLLDRARSITEIADRTLQEFNARKEPQGGHISIGCAQSTGMHLIARALSDIRKDYPLITFSLMDGVRTESLERLNNGIVDFAAVVENPGAQTYNILELPVQDIWGVVMPQDHPLAAKAGIAFDDLLDQQLISPQNAIRDDLSRWCGDQVEKLRFAGDNEFPFNAYYFVREGTSLLLTYKGMIPDSLVSCLVFRPLYPALTNSLNLVWRRHQSLSPAASLFLEKIKELVQ